MNRIRYLPQALLLLVFASQLVLVRVSALTPWKGGGFGMFSTLDHGAFRRITAVVEAPHRSEAVDIAPSLELAEARAVTCPADWLLRRLAAGVAARERRHERPVDTVRLTVWRTEFDRTTIQPTERAIRTFVHYEP
jgi:hypothetical protein